MQVLLVGGREHRRLMNLNGYEQSSDGAWDTQFLFRKHSTETSWGFIKVCSALDLSLSCTDAFFFLS